MGKQATAAPKQQLSFKMAGEPKCGSKTVWTVLMIICYILGGILVIIPMAVGSCGCDGECLLAGYNINDCACWGPCEDKCEYDESWCIKAKSPALTGAAWLGLVIVGVLILILACVFTCGACACCCFKAGAPAADEMDDVVEAKEEQSSA